MKILNDKELTAVVGGLEEMLAVEMDRYRVRNPGCLEFDLHAQAPDDVIGPCRLIGPRPIKEALVAL